MDSFVKNMDKVISDHNSGNIVTSEDLRDEEEQEINGKKEKILVVRKGATRAFGPGHKEVPLVYRKVGQPVLKAIIGGIHQAPFHVGKGR